MDQARWRQVEEIFLAAAERAPAEREALLRLACGGDGELRAEVESLLAHEAGATFIQHAVAGEARLLEREAGEGPVGQRIGPYRLTALVGHGGMGTVYAAVRDDDQYHQQVALKLVRRGLDTEHLLGRFRHERQILATLEHPNIARLLDGGTTRDGLPYLVMEYVEGEPITSYCEARRLPVRGRLELFRQVCGAVHYAHQSLVVHRDLKPGNILVGRQGVVKLLDFGIAKLLEPGPSPEAMIQTDTGLRLMTPEYASPEQVRGEPVTTASDIYSLGVVLYELLAGERPHRLKSYTPSEIERAVCQAEPERPSAAAGRGAGARSKLRKQLEGDLDTIVLKALRKEPERRYSSAEQLSEDIGRHLSGLPVQARKDTAGYRVGKFVRRHKLGVAAGLLVVMSLVGGTIAARHQGRRAERRFGQVRKLANTFLFDFHDKIRDLPGSTEAREMVVKTALEYLDNLGQEAGGDPSLQLELAEAYQRVGEVQGDTRSPSLGHAEAAMQSYRKALGLLQGLAARDGANLDVLRSLIRCHYEIGDLQAQAGDTAGGIEAVRQGLRVAETVDARHTGDERDLTSLIKGYELLGDWQLSSRDAAAALDSYRRTLELCERRLAAYPSDVNQHGLALTQARVGDALAERGDLPGTMESYRQSLAIREALGRNYPSNSRYRRELMVVYNWMGNFSGGSANINLGDKTAALGYYRQGLIIAEDLAAADPKNALARLDLASSYGKMGDALSEADPARSAEFYRKALSVIRDLSESAPGEFRYRRWYVRLLRGSAAPLLKLGDHQGARRQMRQSLETLQPLSDKHPTNAEVRAELHATYRGLGEVMLTTGEFTASADNYRRALEIAEDFSASHPSDLYWLWRLADSYAGFGRLHATLAGNPATPTARRIEGWREARAWYQKTLAVWDKWSRQFVSSVFNTSRRGRAARALAACDAVLAHLENNGRPFSPPPPLISPDL